MGEGKEGNAGSPRRHLARKQCPYCGHSNEYDFDLGAPAQCDACERKFADPMEAKAAYDAMFGSGFRFRLRRHARQFAERWGSSRVRIVLFGVALGTALGEIGRRLWLS